MKRIISVLASLHRYLGIGLCVMFVVWFVSGVAMVYYRTPVITEAARLEFAAPLDLSTWTLPPARVASLAGHWDDVETLRLGRLGDRPLYRWRTSDSQWHSAWADTGDPVRFTAADLEGEARRWLGTRAAYVGEFESESQWSYFSQAHAHYPLHKFSTGGAMPREVLLSSRTGEVVVASTPGSRLLYYLGPGIHYFSFYPIRNNGPLWRGLVNLSSGMGAFACAIGLMIGVWRLRWRAVGQRRRVIPYARFWMYWHHWTGLVFGVLAFTFVLSGLFSMNPGRIFPSTEVPAELGEAYVGARPPLAALPGLTELAAALDGAALKELEYLRVRARPYVLAVSALDQQRLFQTRNSAWAERPAFTQAELLDFFRAVTPAPIAAIEQLDAFDDYYYARKERYRPLPAVRIALDDAQSTWFYLEPASGRLYLRSDEGTRLRRWLYNGLHSLDLAVLLRHEWLWHVVIWVLSLFGLLLSVTGVVISWQWFQRLLRQRQRVRSRRSISAGGATGSVEQI